MAAAWKVGVSDIMAADNSEVGPVAIVVAASMVDISAIEAAASKVRVVDIVAANDLAVGPVTIVAAASR